MWETWVRSLGWEDLPGEGNGNPLQYSCLENPMDGWRSLVGYSPWGRKESDTIEQLHFISPTKLTTSCLRGLTLAAYLLFYPMHLDQF